MNTSAGINGFGRFGQHLLKYWMEHSDSTKFSIDFINDDYLSLDRSFELLTSDRYLKDFYTTRLVLEKDGFVVKLANNKTGKPAQ